MATDWKSLTKNDAHVGTTRFCSTIPMLGALVIWAMLGVSGCIKHGEDASSRGGMMCFQQHKDWSAPHRSETHHGALVRFPDAVAPISSQAVGTRGMVERGMVGAGLPGFVDLETLDEDYVEFRIWMVTAESMLFRACARIAGTPGYMRGGFWWPGNPEGDWRLVPTNVNWSAFFEFVSSNFEDFADYNQVERSMHSSDGVEAIGYHRESSLIIERFQGGKLAARLIPVQERSNLSMKEQELLAFLNSRMIASSCGTSDSTAK